MDEATRIADLEKALREMRSLFKDIEEYVFQIPPPNSITPSVLACIVKADQIFYAADVGYDMEELTARALGMIDRLAGRAPAPEPDKRDG